MLEHLSFKRRALKKLTQVYNFSEVIQIIIHGMERTSNSNLPKYYEMLSNDDKNTYDHLRNLLSAPSCKNRKNKSYQTFCEIMDLLKAFIVRNEAENDWRRAAVCGIFWIDGPSFTQTQKASTIAINIRQLTLVTSKCKSSINGLLQQMGYIMPVQGSEASSILNSIFPFLKNNFQELRQWTIRQRIDNSSIAPKDSYSKLESNLSIFAPIIPSHKIAHLKKASIKTPQNPMNNEQNSNSYQNELINAQKDLISPAPNLINNDMSFTFDRYQPDSLFSINVDTKVNSYYDNGFDSTEKVGIFDDPMAFGSNLINDSEQFSDSLPFNFGNY